MDAINFYKNKKFVAHIIGYISRHQYSVEVQRKKLLKYTTMHIIGAMINIQYEA